MKITHCYFTMEIGGVEQNLLRTLPRLIEEDSYEHELVLIYPRGELLDQLPDELPISSPSRDQLFSDLYERYRETDVLHLYTINDNPIHRLPGYLANARIVDNPRNIISIPHSNRVDRITCASEAIADVQDCPGKVTIIPNGIEIDEENPPSYRKFSKDTPLRLLEIGRGDKNRTHRAEDFMPALKQNFQDLECHVLGREGEDRNGIIFHGYVSDPMKFYRQSHFLTHFVETESFGMTPLEGYRSGVIPVVSGHGGIRDLVEHTETGFFLENPNKGEVIKQLKIIAQRYYEDPTFWIPMAENGFEFLTNNYSIENHLRNYLELYGTLDPEKNRSFPGLEWSQKFNTFFRKLALHTEAIDPQSYDHEKFPNSLERDLGRLILGEIAMKYDPSRVLDFISELETKHFVDHYERYVLEAQAHQLMDNYENSVSSARKAIDCESELSEPYLIAADGYLNQSAVDEALEVLRLFQKRYPEFEPVKDMIHRIVPLRS